MSHLTLAFSHTSLIATIWDSQPDLILEREILLRPLPTSQPATQLTTHSLIFGLDSLLTQLATLHDLSTIRTISGTVPHPASLSLTPDFLELLQNLDSSAPLDALLPALPIIDPFTPVTSALSELDAALPTTHPLRRALAPGSAAAHLVLFPGDKIVTPGYLITSLLLQNPGAATYHEEAIFLGSLRSQEGGYDLDAFATLGVADPARVLSLTTASPGETIGILGRYWRDRWGLVPCRVLPFLPSALATILTATPLDGDIVVIHDDVDHLIVPLDTTSRLRVPGATLLSDLAGGTVAIMHDPNGMTARHLVRDKYGNGRWQTLAHLAILFPPGGSIGLDDKKFVLVHPHPVPGFTPRISGATRFESGLGTTEFRDLRINARCVLESQVLGLRERVVALGVDNTQRVLLLGDVTKNLAVPHLLTHIFDCAVYASDMPNHLPSLGAALVAVAAASQQSIAILLAEAHRRVFNVTPRLLHCPLEAPLTPPYAGSPDGPNKFMYLSPIRNEGPLSPPASDDSGEEHNDYRENDHREVDWNRSLDNTEGQLVASRMWHHSRSGYPGCVRPVVFPPEQKWEFGLYATMLAEFHRLREMAVLGIVTSGAF